MKLELNSTDSEFISRAPCRYTDLVERESSPPNQEKA